MRPSPRRCVGAAEADLTAQLDITSNMQNLRTLVLSVPPRHTPGLESFGTITYIDSSPTMATSHLPASVSPTKKSPIATMTGTASGPSSVLTIMSAAIPPVKDVKRFLRKMPRLGIIEWTGRGAVGSWSIRRTSTSVLAVPKIDFTPIHELLERSHATPRHSGQLASRGLDLSTAPVRPPGRTRSYTQSSSGFTDGSIFDTSGHGGASSTSPSAPDTPEGLKLEGLSFGAFGSGEAVTTPEPVSSAALRRNGSASGVGVIGGARRASVDTAASPKSPVAAGRRRMASNPGLSLPASPPPPSVPEIKTQWGNGGGGRTRQPSAGATSPIVNSGRRASTAKTSPTVAKDEPLSPTKASGSGSSNHNRRQSRSGGAARK